MIQSTFVQRCSCLVFFVDILVPTPFIYVVLFKEVVTVGGKRWNKQHLDKQRACMWDVTLLNLAVTTLIS